MSLYEYPRVEGLSDEDHLLIDFERKWLRKTPSKNAAIRKEFGVPPLRYYQKLSNTIDKPEAAEYDAVTVLRLLRIRDGE